MTTKAKIYLYNFFTVIFAMLTIISLGATGNASMHTVVTNTALFALLTYFCFEKENTLRTSLKKRRQRKVRLAVYSRENSRQVA